MDLNKLTPEETRIIEDNGTEAPFSGEYDSFYKEGVYLCRKCDNPLFSSTAKFDAGCGWPAFDAHFPGSIKQIPDCDGYRTEIQCVRCGGHVGHVFFGEKLTAKNTRHCVNSLSIKFVPAEIATLAGGCFWCTEAVFNRLNGVLYVLSGYTGGKTANPNYDEVCSGTTGHAEAIQIYFDPAQISYQKILEVFWHTHDYTTLNQQGNDVGTQYRSAIFYHSESQKHSAVKSKPEKAVTKIVPFNHFYPAEDYHQNYFEKNPDQPYCQIIIEPKIKKMLLSYQEDAKG